MTDLSAKLRISEEASQNHGKEHEAHRELGHHKDELKGVSWLNEIEIDKASSE